MRLQGIHSQLLRWLPGIALAVYALGILLFCIEEQWHAEWDSAIYMLTARSLAEGSGYTYLGSPFFLRPPGFSYALSFLLREGRFDFAQLNFLMMVSAVAAVGTIYLALRKGEGSRLSLVATLLLATCPLFVARFNLIQSDIPFLVLFFSSVFFLDRAARDERRSIPAIAAGSLLLAAASYFRVAGIALLPGVVLLFLLRRRGRQRLLGLIPTLIVLFLLAPWIHHGQIAAAAAQRPSEQLLLFDYTTAIFRVDPGDPDSDALSGLQWLQRIERNGGRMISGLTACILGTRDIWASALLVAVLLLGLATALIRGPTLLEWHALTYSALLLTYYSHDPRLLIPLLPPVYAYLVDGLRRICQRLTLPSGERGAFRLPDGITAVAFAGLMLLNLVALPKALDQHASRLEVGTVGDTWDDYARSAEWLRDNTPETAAIMTEMAPILSLLSGRRVYTNRFPREPDLLQRYGINYVVSFWWSSRRFEHRTAARAEQRWLLPSQTRDQSIRIYKIADRH
jgi:hypothetical protein